MVTKINAGRVAMVPKGEWSASTAYVRLDVVQYNGSSYVCKQDSTGQNPSTATTYWQLLASGVDPSNYYTKTETNTKLGGKQDALVSGQNIKSINGLSVLGTGNLELGELFVVRMTRNNSNSVYTADKSVSEIYEASYTNGKPVIAVVRDINNPVLILTDCDPDADGYVFSAIESNVVTTLRWQQTDDYTYELETMLLQPRLVSGTNIKTVNSESLLGSGNVTISGKSAYQSYVDTTTDSPVKTEAEWVASLKGEDGVSLGEVAIADNLTTDDATKVLSAKQGYLLGQKVNDVDDVPTAGSEKFVKSGGVANLHYNKIQLAKSTNTDWSKVIVNAYVKNWIGGSKRLFLGHCYKNDPNYGSGIFIYACDSDFSNSSSPIIHWSGSALGNIGVNVKGLKILPERDIVIDGVNYGKLSVEVNWDAIPNGWNAPISPKYYLDIKTNTVQAEAEIRQANDSEIKKSLLNQVPYIAGSLPMIDKTSELQWIKDCSPALLASFLIDFKIVGTPQEGYEYSFRGFNYKSGTQGVTPFYCWFGIYKKEISSDTYSIVATFSTSDVATGYKEYTIDDMQFDAFQNPTISDIKVALNWDAIVSLKEKIYTFLTTYGYKFNQDYIFDLNIGPLAKDAKLKVISDTANDILDSVQDVNNAVFEYVVENLTNYESLLSGAYIKASDHTIEANQYTSAYKIYLFRLPAGNYIFETTGNTPSSVDIIGIIDSVEDFQVGGVLSESILVGSPAKSVSRTFDSETLVVLLSRYGSINNSGYIKKRYKQSKISTLEEQIEDIEEQISPSLKIIIPNTVYAVVGTELNLWNDTISLSVDKGLCSPINYQVRWNCTKGLITDRCFRFTPSNEDASHNYTCVCYLYDMRNNLIDSKQFTIKVLAKNALQVAKNIAYFGDSLGQAAAGQLYTNFHNSDKFTGVIPSMVGTRGTTYKYDASGGYKWLDYATVGRTGYRSSVSGVASISLGAVYTDGVANFEVIEVNIVDGVGNILLHTHYTHSGTLIMPSGTLTKVSGGGDNTVPYTDAFEESVNPLWNDTTQQLDAAQYKQLVGLQPTDKIDAVSFQFGVNEAANHDMDNILTYIDSLYHCFVDDNPDCKFIIGLNTSAGNDVNGSGSNYGASFNWSSYLEYSYKIRQLYMTLQNNQNYPNIRIAPINLQVDRYYGYAFSTRPISQRYTENEQYHNNYVHPGSSGYGQIGDAYFATYIGVLTE